MASQAAVVYPLAKVTITTGNLSFTSTAKGGQLAIGTEAESGHIGVARPAAAALIDNRPGLGVSVTASVYWLTCR